MDAALTDFLIARMPDARDHKVTHLVRVPGGASRETWMFKATWQDDEGRQSQQLILRKDPRSAIMETERRLEFDVLAALAGSAVPVPRVLWLEEDVTVLGGAFIIMERVVDGDPGPLAFVERRWDGVRPLLGRRMYESVAALHAFDWRSTSCARMDPSTTGEPVWRVMLDHWARALHAPGHSPQPIAEAALRWLRRNPPPPPAQLALVHGDYRVGNILFGSDGEIRSVLDWETAHIGDPLEDLAWSFLPAWEWAGDGLKGGIIAEEEAIAIYERASGGVVERDALHWWSVACGVKWQVVATSSASLAASGKSTGAILPFMAMTMMGACDRFLLTALGRDS